jgi:hypothetical protein
MLQVGRPELAAAEDVVVAEERSSPFLLQPVSPSETAGTPRIRGSKDSMPASGSTDRNESPVIRRFICAPGF